MKSNPPPLLVSYDPGLRHSGLSLFTHGTLTHAVLIKSPERSLRGPEAWYQMALAVDSELTRLNATPDVFVTEYPQHYFGKTRNAGDLLELAGVVGAVVGRCWAAKRVGYLPHQWKGNVPADVMLERIESRLAGLEKDAIQKCPKSLRHNILDAVGVGLYCLGRL